MATPTLVRRVIWAHTGTGEAGGNTFKLPVPASLASNCLIFWMQYPSGATLSSIADNIGNTWSTTPLKAVTDSGNGMTMAVFAIFGATAGVNLLTITFSASIQGFKPAYMEWCNVATSSASDATPTGQVATATPITSGSLTTATAGDLVLHFVSCTDNGSNNESGNFDGISKFAAASSYAFVPGQVDLNDGFACEYEIQGSAGATNPGMGCTLTAGAFSFPSITIALKSASAGTPQAAGIQVVGVHWMFLNGKGSPGSTAYPWQLPTSGNCQVMVISDQIGAINLISVSGASSGAWATPLTSTSGQAQGTYVTNSTPSTNELLTVTLNDVGSHGSIFGMIVDIANAGAFDTFAVTNGTTNYGPGNTSPVAPITPGVQAGIVVSVMGNETGPSDAVVTPTGAIFTCPVYTGQGDFSGLTNGDNYGYFNFSSNATQNWVYHDTAASTGFDALEISIAAQSNAPTSVPTQAPLLLPGGRPRVPPFLMRPPQFYPPAPQVFPNAPPWAPEQARPPILMPGGKPRQPPFLLRPAQVYPLLTPASTPGVLAFFGVSATTATFDPTGSSGFLNINAVSDSVATVGPAGGMGLTAVSTSSAAAPPAGGIGASGVSATTAAGPPAGGMGASGVSASTATVAPAGGIGTNAVSVTTATVDFTGSPGFISVTGVSATTALYALSPGAFFVSMYGASGSTATFDMTGSPGFLSATGASVTAAIFPLSGGVGIVGASGSTALLQLAGGIGLFGVADSAAVMPPAAGLGLTAVSASSAAVPPAAGLGFTGVSGSAAVVPPGAGFAFNGAAVTAAVYSVVGTAPNVLSITGVSGSYASFTLTAVGTTQNLHEIGLGQVMLRLGGRVGSN